MDKKLRHQLIKQAIREEAVNSQSDLVDYLAKRGYQITQATISRDMQELHVVKTTQDDQFIYRLPEQRPEQQDNDSFQTVLREAHARIDCQDNLINVETLPGSGSVIADAIKQRHWPEIFSVIPTDDSVLLILKRKPAAVETVWERLTEILK